MFDTLISILKREPPHCSNCGLVKEKVTQRFGYDRTGTPKYESVFACPRQNRMYVFDYSGSNCHSLPPWYCQHELDAWNEKRPWYGACRLSPCPLRNKLSAMDEL